MAMRTRSKIFAGDVEQRASVSRSKAVQIIKDLGGDKDVRGRWQVDSREFFVWYNNPARCLSKGDNHMKSVGAIVAEVRDFAGTDSVSFSIHRRSGRKNYQLRVYAPGGRRREISLGTPDGKAARDVEAAVRARFNEQRISGIIPCGTQKFMDDWLDVKSRESSHGTFRRYRPVVEKVLPFLPADIHMTGQHHIEGYRQWLVREGYSPRSIILELNVLQSIFKAAVKMGHTRVNPVDDVSRPKRPPTKVEAYTPDELSALFAEMERRAAEALPVFRRGAWRAYLEVFHCLNYTGMRVSDAINLTWNDVNMAFSTITLRQVKTGKTAYIRMPTPFKERLQVLAGERGDLSGPVFLNSAGQPLSYQLLDFAIRKALKTCGIRKKSPIHSFRHTTAMRLLSAGVPVHQVANQLGDSVETVVRNYIRPAAPGQDAIDAAYSQVTPFCHPETADIRDFSASAGAPGKPAIPKNTSG